jgi:hypothetical protein
MDLLKLRESMRRMTEQLIHHHWNFHMLQELAQRREQPTKTYDAQQPP